jgi:IMP dehydrogenase
MIPKFNNIESRTETNLSTRLTTGTTIDIPIVAANMDTVIGPRLAEILVDYGSQPIFHRFYPKEKEKELIDLIQQFAGGFVSWGVGPLDNLKSILDIAGALPFGVCFDIAHGHSRVMFDRIEELRKWEPALEVIAGNICTPQAFHDLVNAGAHAVKVGIGPGSVCTTRNVTAFGVPQFTAVQSCAKIARELKTPMIADGGIKGSREIILALAAGASSVMVGNLFAQTSESEGHGFYRGQASRQFQEDYYGEVKEGTVPEGEDLFFEKLWPASQMLDELLGGVRSGMTYGGANSIKELQRKAEFMRVTRNYL